MMPKDPFAEVEVVEDTGSVVQGHKIPTLEHDPVREKFYDMRSLAPNNPDEWRSPKLFYRQGKFMEHFTDDYDKVATLSMYSPSYQRLGYEQLRTYFTWRTKARVGEFVPVPLSYVYIYVDELLNGLGVQNAAEGLDRLMRLWNAFREKFPILDDDMPRWLKDYHVYYEVPHSFAEFVEEHKLQEFYEPSQLAFDYNPETAYLNWAAACRYKLEKFYIYNNGSKELIHKAFAVALRALDKFYSNMGDISRRAYPEGRKKYDSFYVETNEYVEKYGSPYPFIHYENFQDVFFLEAGNVPWRPFEDTMFFHKENHMLPDRTVRLSPQEVYICSGNKWTTTKFIFRQSAKMIVGYIILCVNEVMLEHARELRSKRGGKGKIGRVAKLPWGESYVYSCTKSAGLCPDRIKRIIKGAISTEYNELSHVPVTVTVDTKNLDRIREEAEETQEKLIVEEEAATSVVASIVQKPFPVAVERTQSNDNPWHAFRNALAAVEFEALKLAITNPAGIKAFAQEQGIMPEILADGINEKAMDTIGDNILEFADELEIYEDYLADFQSII